MRRVLLTFLACVGLALLAEGAHAQPEQTPAEMRREIDLLRQRVAQLEAQLESAVERADRLESENRELRRQLAAAQETNSREGSGERVESLEVPIDKPLEKGDLPEAWESSPESLFAALQASYERAMRGASRESRADEERYLARVGRWVREAEREFRGDVEWTVRVTRVLERPDHGGDVMMQVVDPGTGRAWGEAFTMVMPRAYRELLDEAPGRNYWIVSGTLTATPRVNRERDEPGFFLHPLFIGAFAEFDYAFKVRRMIPTTLEPAEGEGPASAPPPDAEPAEPA